MKKFAAMLLAVLMLCTLALAESTSPVASPVAEPIDNPFEEMEGSREDLDAIRTTLMTDSQWVFAPELDATIALNDLLIVSEFPTTATYTDFTVVDVDADDVLEVVLRVQNGDELCGYVILSNGENIIEAVASKDLTLLDDKEDDLAWIPMTMENIELYLNLQ